MVKKGRGIKGGEIVGVNGKRKGGMVRDTCGLLFELFHFTCGVYFLPVSMSYCPQFVDAAAAR